MRFTFRPWRLSRLKAAQAWRITDQVASRSRRHSAAVSVVIVTIRGNSRSAKRPRRDRAVLSVVIGLILFATVQVATGVAIQTEWSPLRDPLYFDATALLHKHRAFYPGLASAPDKPVTVLLVGSSRMLNAADAQAATRIVTEQVHRPVEVFNFGQAGAGPITNAVYLQRLQRDGAKPDFVLIEIHPVFLAGQRSVLPESRWLLPFRLSPEELPVVRQLGFPAETPASHGCRGFIAPLYEYRFLILDRYTPYFLMNNCRMNGGRTNDDYGFSRLEEAVTTDRRATLLSKTKRQYVVYCTGYRPTGPGVTAIRAILEHCQAAGWQAGLVLMPESSELRSWYSPEGLRELDALLAKLSADYRVPVFDAREWVADPLSEDGHHLTGVGADVFTERLAREALTPWILRTLDSLPGQSRHEE